MRISTLELSLLSRSFSTRKLPYNFSHLISLRRQIREWSKHRGIPPQASCFYLSTIKGAFILRPTPRQAEPASRQATSVNIHANINFSKLLSLGSNIKALNGKRSFSTIPSSRPEDSQDVQCEKLPEFPPNIAAEVFESMKSANESKTMAKVPKQSDTAQNSSQLSLRQATRIALTSIPGGAYVVMQQQHLIAKLISSRFRTWQNLRERSRKAQELQSCTQNRGRRTNKQMRRKNGLSVSHTKPTVNVEGAREVNQPLTESAEPSFLKHTSIQDALVGNSTVLERMEPNGVADSKVGATGQLLANELPTDLQLSIEVCLGVDQPDMKVEDSLSDIAGIQQTTSSVDGETTKEEHDLDRSELLRNYEAVLQVVLASGVVEADAKRFLSEYRKRCNIEMFQHTTALNRLGWSQEEYDQGFSTSTSRTIPGWRLLLKRILDTVEERGAYLVTLGSLTSLASIMMANMIHLRMLQLMSGILYFTFNMTRRPPVVSAACWNLVFFAINCFMLVLLFVETRPETFTEDELDLFERHFLITGLSPRQFKKLLAIAHWRNVPKGEILVKQGTEVTELMIVHRGSLSVLMNDSEVETLKGGDRNAIIGIKTFLMRLDHVRCPPGKSSTTPTPTSTIMSVPSSNGAFSVTSGLSNVSTEMSVSTEATSEVGKEKQTAIAEPDIEDVHPSHTSVVVLKDALLLVWSMEELVKRVNSDPINLGFPLVGGMARSLVARSRNQYQKQSLTSYEAVVKAVLADGEVRTQEKRFLCECRTKFNVSEEQHWLLIEQLGWSREEFEDGAKASTASLQSANRAIRGILTAIREQISRSPSNEPSATNHVD